MGVGKRDTQPEVNAYDDVGYRAVAKDYGSKDSPVVPPQFGVYNPPRPEAADDGQGCQDSEGDINTWFKNCLRRVT